MNEDAFKYADTLRILITTDNHVGYQENDPVRGDDSWKSFDEIMYMAKDHDVDFILQAGDLFHINKPTKKSMFHVMKSLRNVCYGNKPIEFELLSDPSLAIDNRGINHANFQDPNINVSIPLFAIAGNHDDSTGDELLDPMDLLSVSGLINHFGKNLENDKVTVCPLLLQKGSTKLALYGLSNIRDERLYRTFVEGNVKFLRASGEHKDSFFNLLAVHQNHTAHTDTSYLPESFLPSFLDFIVWGHEHECLPYTTPAPNGGVVLQPGSSVATSLSPAEMARKHVFILSVKGKSHSLEALPLKSARPFKMKTIDLADTDIETGPGNEKEVVNYLKDEIEELINEAQNEWLELNKPDEVDNYEGGYFDEEELELQIQKRDELVKNVPLPLIRAKVEYSDGYEIENPRRFSNRFVGQVANINDVVLFQKKKVSRQAQAKNKKNDKGKDAAQALMEEELKNLNVTHLIDSFLNEDELNLISKRDINDAITTFVDKEDKNALKDFIKVELESDFKELLRLEVGDNRQDNNDKSEDSLKEMKRGFQEILKEISKEKRQELKYSEAAEAQKKKNKGDYQKPKPKKSYKSEAMVVDSGSDLDSAMSESETTVAPTRRSTRQRKTTKTANDVEEDVEIVSDDGDGDGGDYHRNRDDDFLSDDDDDEFAMDIAPPPPPASSRLKSKRNPAVAAAAASEPPKSQVKRKPKGTASNSQNVMDLVKKMAKK